MQRRLDILWQKENSHNSDLYMDIFAIKGGHQIHLKQTQELVGLAYGNANSSKLYRKNLYAECCREEGMELFQQGNYIEAMQKFNFGLAFATKGTAEMGTAFANRSMCFLHLNLFKECLIDIEMARKSGYPSHLMYKLDECVAKCTNSMNDAQFKSTIFNVQEPKLSFNEHAKFAGVADCLKLQKNDEFGRHIITTCDLKIGQTILVEKPFAIASNRKNTKTRSRCIDCFKDLTNFVTCDNCVSVYFSCANCSEMSINHKFECNGLSRKQTYELCEKETFDLVLRMFFNINAIFPDVDALIETVDLLLKCQDAPDLITDQQKAFGSIFQLAHNHEKQSHEHMRQLRMATATAIAVIMRQPILKRKFAALKYRRFLQHLCLHLFHVAEHSIDLLEYHQENNNEPIIKYSLEEYASGMYPFACYLNHSCCPNVCCFSVDDRLICKVISPIKKGEQVLRSYM